MNEYRSCEMSGAGGEGLIGGADRAEALQALSSRWARCVGSPLARIDWHAAACVTGECPPPGKEWNFLYDKWLKPKLPKSIFKSSLCVSEL